MPKKEEELNVEFQNAPEEEVSFIPEGEAPPDPDAGLPEEVKKLSKAELYERLKAQEERETPDPTERITSAFEKAISSMKPAAAPLPVQLPGESDGAFAERVKKDLFDEDKSLSVLNEVVDRRAAAREARTSELLFKQAEKLMELDPATGPIYKKYKADIQDYMKRNFPPDLQRNPQALEYAFKEVRSEHLEEIAQERALALLEEEKRKTPSREETRRSPLPLEAGGASPGATPAARKKVVVITQEDRRRADEMGVEPEVVAARRAARES